MSKKIALYALLIVFSVICGITAGIVYVKTEPNHLAIVKSEEKYKAEPQVPIQFQQKEIEQPVELELPADKPVYESEKYIVTLSDTKILIYKIASDGSMQTIEEKPISTGSIPREDYQKLYSGIVVESLESAIELLEDYLS